MPRGLVNPNYNYEPQAEEPESIDLTPITTALERVVKAVNGVEVAKEVEVSNIDRIKLYLRQELADVIKAVKAIDIPEAPKEVKVSNFPRQEKTEEVRINNLSELGTLLTRLIKTVEDITVSPVVNVPTPIVNVPEQQAPIVNIPQALPPIVSMDVSAILAKLDPLKLLSRDPNKPITVRMSDGRHFIDAIANTLKENGERLATVVSTSYGLTKSEYKVAQRELAAPNATNGKITVGDTSTAILAARNRVSIVLTNDSSETIYVAKGTTAVMNQGIRLNASGGAIVIEDWDGAISAICSSGAKNLCYCEAY